MPKRSKKSKITHKAGAQKTVLDDHKRIGKKFISPMAQLGLQVVHWVDTIIPELIWLALINTELGVRRGAELTATTTKLAAKISRKKIKPWFAVVSAFESLTNLQKNNWSGLNTRSMAIEADCIDLYNYAYSPFSSCVHGMWSHIGRLNLSICSNPLHKFHAIPDTQEHYPDLSFLDIAAKYLSKSFAEFDELTKVEPNLEDGRKILNDAFVRVADELDKIKDKVE